MFRLRTIEKMEILKTQKLCWKYVTGLYLNENASIRMKLLSSALNFINVFATILVLIGSFIKLYYEELGTDERIFIFFQFLVNSSSMIIYVCYWFRKTRLMKLCENFQEVVSFRFNQTTAKIYEKTEAKIDTTFTWVFVSYCIAYHAGFVLVTLILLISSMISGQIDVHTWPLQVQLRFALHSRNRKKN